jgi:hypothetical protein
MSQLRADLGISTGLAGDGFGVIVSTGGRGARTWDRCSRVPLGVGELEADPLGSTIGAGSVTGCAVGVAMVAALVFEIAAEALAFVAPAPRWVNAVAIPIATNIPTTTRTGARELVGGDERWSLDTTPDVLDPWPPCIVGSAG